MMDVMWFDGELRHSSTIEIRPFSHALHYGSGVFEGLRVYETARGRCVFRMRDHMRRLYNSAHVYGLDVPYDIPTLENAIVQTITANDFSEGYIRPLIFFGENSISLAPRFQCPTHAMIALRPLTGSLIGETPGARVCISSWAKTSSRALPSTVKACGHYTNSVLALQEAVANGFDEAILLNDRGEVSEGTGENIFVVKNGILRTNDATADILEGITRDTVLSLAREHRIPVEIAPIQRDDLLAADEVFFTGTAAEIMPIVQVNDKTFASNHPLTTHLQQLYADTVRGKAPHYADWLTLL
jgi:branched-chain amino acid aminotransferase